MWLCILGILFLAHHGLQTGPLGAKCKQDVDCGDNNTTHCFSKVCSCRVGHIQNDNKTQCVPQVIGRNCIKSPEECGIAGAYCDNGKCGCLRDSFVPSANKTMCLKVVNRLRGYCDEDQQCTSKELGDDAVCVNRECVCRYGATNMIQPCSPRKKLDDWCTHSQQCQTIAHASCVQKKCACDPYFVPHSFSRQQCIPIATTLGSPCIETFQCTLFGAGGFCSNSQCLCRSKYHFVLNRTISCVLNKGLGEACGTSDECYLPLDGEEQRAECRDSVCACRAGFVSKPFILSCTSTGSLHRIFSMTQLIIFVSLSFTITFHRTSI